MAYVRESKLTCCDRYVCVSDLFGKGARLNGGSDPAVSEPKTTASLNIIQS